MDETPEKSELKEAVNLNNSEVENIDNKQYNTIPSKTNTSVSVVANATNSHPLMYSPISPLPSDYPDLIPEKPKCKVSFRNPENSKSQYQANPSVYSVTHSEDGTHERNIELPTLENYNEQLPDFPESPSALKKYFYDLPIEIHEVSDSENEKSVYEARLSSNFQKVSLRMNDKEGTLNFLAYGKCSNKLRRVKVVEAETDNDSDVSSVASNTDSLKSEDIFNEFDSTENPQDGYNDSQCVDDTPEPIEPLSAVDERKHARHWQRMILPGGEQRTIDMRVIEPYKRILSHGGYLRAGGHTAIVIFSACFLPDKSRVDYDYVMDNLFLYVLWTLERLVTDDYVLIYLHGGATKLPSFSWLKRCYQVIGRRLRKNLSHLYLVHPTLWIRTMFFMAKPFISEKFYRKLTFVGSLRELSGRVPLEVAAIPDKVKKYESLHSKE